MKLFNWMREGNSYGCGAGDHVGSILIFIEKTSDSYGFLKIPTMENIWVPKDKFDFGVKQCIIEYIERVPKYVRKTSKSQFYQNKQGKEL